MKIAPVVFFLFVILSLMDFPAHNSFSYMQNFYFLVSRLSSLSPIRTMDRFQET